MPKNLLYHLRKAFQRKLTLMLVPHHSVRSFHVQFSFSFALFMFIFWTSVTSWATWVVLTNVDYWSMKVNHEILKLKVQYFATELKKSREVLNQVYEADIQLRQLLGMKNRQSIISQKDDGQGGPEPFDSSILQKTLNKNLWEISDDEIRQASNRVFIESEERLKSFKEICEHIAYERSLYRSIPRGWPTHGRMTSHYGQRISPMHGGPQFHTGIDIANVRGTPILATGDGIVTHADWEGGYGRLVIIDHGFGYVTFYGHNSELLVKKGDSIKRGQVIAQMGSSGSSTGDHVHYEVWQNGRYVNPFKYIGVLSSDEL